MVIGGIDAPGINVLAHRGEHGAEKPTVSASGTGLKEHKVVLFAFDGAFGAGARIFVTLPERTVPGDEGMQAIVLLGVSVDDAAIG